MPVVQALSTVNATVDNAYVAQAIDKMRDGVERTAAYFALDLCRLARGERGKFRCFCGGENCCGLQRSVGNRDGLDSIREVI